MSVATEIITLEGINLEGAPPCEIIVASNETGDYVCGLPSAFRLRTTFCACGLSDILFICREHKEQTEKGMATCRHCYGVRYVREML